jgi:hypothetical protein
MAPQTRESRCDCEFKILAIDRNIILARSTTHDCFQKLVHYVVTKENTRFSLFSAKAVRFTMVFILSIALITILVKKIDFENCLRDKNVGVEDC